MVLAGTFVEDKEKKGGVNFNGKTLEEAGNSVETDPPARAGIFASEVTKYYGSAALRRINELHPRLRKKKM